jgi:hypothetical protein
MRRILLPRLTTLLGMFLTNPTGLSIFIDLVLYVFNDFTFLIVWKLLFKDFFIIFPTLFEINFFVKKEHCVPLRSYTPSHCIKRMSNMRKDVFSPTGYSKLMSMISFSIRMTREPLIPLRTCYVCMLPWIRDMI